MKRSKQLETEKQQEYRRNRKVKQGRFRKNQDSAQERCQNAHAHGPNPGTRQVFNLHRPKAERTAKHPEEPAEDAHRHDAERVCRKRNDQFAYDHAHCNTRKIRPRRKPRPRLKRDHICAKRKNGENDAQVAISQCRTPQKSFVKHLRTKFRPLYSGANGAPVAFRTPRVPPPDSCE